MKIVKVMMVGLMVIGLGISAAGCGKKKDKEGACDKAFLKCTEGGGDVNVCKTAQDACKSGGKNSSSQ